jgi:hypothetical protein
VDRIYHLDRGYDQMEAKLRGIGADIESESNDHDHAGPVQGPHLRRNPAAAQGAGIEVLEDPEKSRKLILATNQPDVRVVLVRATDVPTYVQYGGADLGVTGWTRCWSTAAGPVPAAGPADCQMPHERGGARRL